MKIADTLVSSVVLLCHTRSNRDTPLIYLRKIDFKIPEHKQPEHFGAEFYVNHSLSRLYSANR
jgi:hypothetical protein